MTPLVSVVVPCYNQGRYLRESIGSLRAQSLRDWECIVVDDGSSDNSQEIARGLAEEDERVRVFAQENRGPSAARNRGVAEARGRYLQFLDADDLLEPDKLQVHVAYLESTEGVSIVYGDVRYFTDEYPDDYFFGIWGETGPWVTNLAALGEPLLEKVLSRNIMAMNCPIFPRSVLERIGPFSVSVLGCEDWEYWIRCAANGERFHYLEGPNTLALVRSHATSTSRDLSRMLDGECRFRVKVGYLLRGNHFLRLQNFEKAANRLGELNPPDYHRRLWELANANATARVYTYAFLRMLDRGDKLRAVARSLRVGLGISSKGVT
ncbi:MAG: glycosyltransferase family 2 protein [Chthoniobacterales bacterium]